MKACGQFAMFISLWLILGGASQSYGALSNSQDHMSYCGDPALAEVGSKLNQITLELHPWNNFQLSKLKLLIHTSETDVYSYGFAKDDLDRIGINGEMCKDGRFIKLDISIPMPKEEESFFEILNDYMVLSERSEILRSVVEIASPAPVVQTSIPTFDYFRMRIVPILVHESFHGFQNIFWSSLPNARGDFLDSCAAIGDWKKSFSKEVEIWSQVYKDFDHYTVDESKELAERLLSIRSANLDNSGVRSCWDQLGVWERIEGSAQYVEFKVAEASGLLTRDYIDEQIYAFIDINWETFGESEIYYATGKLYFDLLSNLDPSGSWQKLIAAGDSPATALQKLLTSQIISERDLSSVPHVFQLGPWCQEDAEPSSEEQQIFKMAEQSREQDPDVKKWQKLDDSTIRFDGIIEDEYAEFRSLLKQTPNFKTLIVNSAGGSTKEALTIARMVLPYRAHIVVDGYCGSSCANYLFTSGLTKEIKRGWVGYHGNVKALFESKTPEERKVELRVIMEQHGLEVDDEELDRIAAGEEADFLTEIEMEREFYSALGVSQVLFDLTQRLDKGVPDGGQYDFLLLSAKAFEFFGIKNVTHANEQSLCNAEKLLKTAPYLLINKI